MALTALNPHSVGRFDIRQFSRRGARNPGVLSLAQGLFADGIRCFGLALAALATAWPCLAQDTSLWSYQGPDRSQKLAEAARKEGTLTLYTSLSQKDLAPLLGPFEQKYDIKVKVWRSGSENVLNRVVKERAARHSEVDAVHSSGLVMESLHREKVFHPVDSPYQKDLVPGALRPHRGWAATYLAVWVQAYNTNLVKKEDLPKTFADLLQPKWKGKLGIEADVPEWYSTVVLSMGEEKGIKFFTDLVKQNGISVRKGHSVLNNLVVAGDVPLALTDYSYMPANSKKDGAPIDWFVLDPVVSSPSGVGVVLGAPHPNAALLFYDYMLSTAGQNGLLSLNYVPTNSKVPSPLGPLRTQMVDPALALDQGEKWVKSFEEVVKLLRK